MKTSGSVNICENNSILLFLYSLLTLDFNLLHTLSLFESKFPFYNSNFVSSIIHLSYHAFRCRFLNFEHHNEHYESHFFNDFLERAHCLKDCDICSKHDSFIIVKLILLLPTLDSITTLVINSNSNHCTRL